MSTAKTPGHVKVELRDTLRIAAIHGEVDVSNVEEITKELEGEPRDRARYQVIDLSATDFFDSSGIRRLFALADRLQARRQTLFVVCPPTGLIRRLLDLTGLGHVASIHPTLDSVVEQMRSAT